MRVSSKFFKIVINAPKADQIIEVTSKGKTITMRVLKFKLASGITETLITNIFDEDFLQMENRMNKKKSSIIL